MSPAQRVEIRLRLGRLAGIMRSSADILDDVAPTLPSCPGADCSCQVGGLQATLMAINSAVVVAMGDRDLILAWLSSGIADAAAPKEIPHA